MHFHKSMHLGYYETREEGPDYKLMLFFSFSMLLVTFGDITDSCICILQLCNNETLVIIYYTVS